MPRVKKKPMGRIETGLTPEEQHELYTLLNKHPYHVGSTWLASKGIALSIVSLGKWYTWYAAQFAFGELQRATEEIGAQLRDAGVAISDPNIMQAAARLFQRKAFLRLDDDKFMRWSMEDRRLRLQEEALKLDRDKFKRLERIEEEARKALSSGGTEAEMIKQFKEILGFQ